MNKFNTKRITILALATLALAACAITLKAVWTVSFTSDDASARSYMFVDSQQNILKGMAENGTFTLTRVSPDGEVLESASFDGWGTNLNITQMEDGLLLRSSEYWAFGDPGLKLAKVNDDFTIAWETFDFYPVGDVVDPVHYSLGATVNPNDQSIVVATRVIDENDTHQVFITKLDPLGEIVAQSSFPSGNSFSLGVIEISHVEDGVLLATRNSYSDPALIRILSDDLSLESEYSIELTSIEASADKIVTIQIEDGQQVLVSYDLAMVEQWRVPLQTDGGTYFKISIHENEIVIAGRDDGEVDRVTQLLVQSFDLEGNSQWLYEPEFEMGLVIGIAQSTHTISGVSVDKLSDGNMVVGFDLNARTTIILEGLQRISENTSKYHYLSTDGSLVKQISEPPYKLIENCYLTPSIPQECYFHSDEPGHAYSWMTELGDGDVVLLSRIKGNGVEYQVDLARY